MAISAIVVVHGIGEQERGGSGKALAEAVGEQLMARQAPSRSPINVAATGELLLPDGDHGFGVSAPGYRIMWRGKSHVQKMAVYELHWAKKRSNFILDQLRNLWQLFFAIPRLGLQALRLPPSNASSRFLLPMTRVLYVALWSVLIIHVAVNLVLILGRSFFSLGKLQSAEWQARVDLVLWGLLCLVTLFLFALKLRVVILSLVIAFLSALKVHPVIALKLQPVIRPAPTIFPALLALVVSQMATMTLEEAFAAKFIKTQEGKTPPPPGAAAQPQEAVAAAAGTNSWPFDSFPTGADAQWFYAANTFPGLFPFVNFGLVSLWFLVAALWFLRIRFLLPAADAVLGADRMLRSSRKMGCVVIAVSVIGSGWGLWDFYQLWSGNPPIMIADADPRDPWQWVAAQVLLLYSTWIIYPFVALSLLVLFSHRFRKAAAPIVDLALDVLNYFPPLPHLDRSKIFRWIYGGVQDPNEPNRDRLRKQLAALLCGVERKHGSPILVVSHSLGSIITLSALEHLSVASTRLCGKVDLVTMGSPLGLLSVLYPFDYGEYRSTNSGEWDLRAVQSWNNYYRGADMVGRALMRLTRTTTPPNQVNDELLGAGGHADYFGDPEVAKCICERL